MLMKQPNFVVPTGQNGYLNGINVIRKYQKVNGGSPMHRLPVSG
jgi:hypothetical protein